MLLTGVRNKVCQLRADNPNMTLVGIGTLVGVSRERVRQLLKAEELPTRGIRIKKWVYTCIKCGKSGDGIPKTGLCKACLYPKVIVNCDYCGKEKIGGYNLRKHLSNFNNKLKYKYTGKYYCNRTCMTNKRRKAKV